MYSGTEKSSGAGPGRWPPAPAQLVTTDEAGDYALCELGERLKPAMSPLLDWALEWDNAIRARD